MQRSSARGISALTIVRVSSDTRAQFLDRKGNKRVNLIYEANIPSATKKITAQSPFEYICALHNRT
jgi:hypothetical protein